jgi:omega-amidase
MAATVAGSSFRLALIQLGHTSSSKAANLERARTKILEALNTKPRPDLVVLPECFNSPYGAHHFPEYAEDVGPFAPHKSFSAEHSPSETVRMLSQLAKDQKVWIVGGSIPELEASTSNLFNTSFVFSREGAVVARHRKVHLFDIDVRPFAQRFLC